MDLLDQNPHERNSDIDSLIIAATAASGDEPIDTDMAVEECVNYEGGEGTSRPGQAYWHPGFLHSEHVAAIQEAARNVLVEHDRHFLPDSYSKKFGTELDYQEMMDLMDFKGEEEETVDHIESMRKHSMVFEASGAHSQALPLYEQAVNEAAYQISTVQPAAIFHKRDLAMLAKIAVRMTGFEFPISRAANYTPMDDYVTGSSSGTVLEAEENTQSLRPSTAAPASASMLLQKSGLLAPRRDALKPELTAQEYAIIARAAQELAPELPNLALKSRDQCSLVENFVYTDAVRLMNISPERLDEEMEYIRDVSAIYGRYQSGPRMPSPRLSPYEMGMNEAAACVAKLRPSLLTHTLHLTEWARRVLTLSGLQLSRIPAPSSPSHHQSVHGDRWPQRGGSSKNPSGQMRIHGNEAAFGGTTGCGLTYSSEYLSDFGGGGGGGFSITTAADASSGDVIDYESSCGLDSSELIQPLGGAQAIALLSDFSLEKLGRAQFTVVDPRTDAEFENCPLELLVEEDDTPLDMAEILRLSGADSLENATELLVPCSGYTSVNAFDLTRCTNLKELDLSENALRVFPRRLHLANLKKLGLSGNRFIHLPLIEQFPKLTRLTIDERLKQLLNPQMLAYFCPKLKVINGQFFDEICSDFTIRVIQEARAIMEPYIRSKWENEFADRLQPTSTQEERLRSIETMIQQLKDNFMLDDTVVPYKNLLAYRIVDEYLRSKQQQQQLPDLEIAAAEADSAAQREREKRANELATALEAEVPMPNVVDDDEESTAMLSSSANVDGGSGGEPQSTAVADLGEAIVVDDGEDESLHPAAHYEGDEEDEEEREAEARTAGERALFDAADELLGVNFPDPLLLQQQQQSQPMQMMVLDSMGRLTQQQVIPVTPHGQMQMGAMQNQPPYQMHLGKSLRAGRSIVMTVVRPSGISGRPVAEFLPGELRNKDYVKGYMASEIYKKTVKETLGQKATPRKRNGPGRPRKSEPASTIRTPGAPVPALVPLSEINPSDLGSIKNPVVPPLHSTMPRSGQNMKRATATGGILLDDAGLGGNAAGLPPRPKKRKPLGMHRSLRDLCAEPTYGFTPSYLTPSGTVGGLRTDASMIDYDPLHFIRCHAKDNDAGDSETKVWRCLFEPNPLRPEETTHVVATCGGECVCLINCATGKVMKRFKHMEEEFYTIAWTTVEVEGNKRTNILAAAGRMREIRLLHPEQLVCYAEMKGHTEDITAMIFHQTQPTILFSGDSKASVIVWDIGVPSVPDYKTRYQLLMRLRCPRLDVNPVLNLVFLPHYAYLIAGCEDGLFAWKITDLRLEKREREPDMELKLEVDHEVCIDGLAQLSDNSLVIKVVESGEIMVFDFAAVLERRKGLQRVVPIEMRGHLYWQKTDEIYINVSVRQNLGAVICGDNEGAIWIYDLDPYLDDLHSSSRKKFFVKPIKILEWPECSVQGNRDEDQQLKESITSGFRNPVVNSVEMSSDGHFLAAVTDNNLVCIWRYAPPITTAAPVAPSPAPATADSTVAATAASATATDEVGNPIDTILINIPTTITGSTVETIIQSDPSTTEPPSQPPPSSI
ncbi:Leucine-rich repeat and WD repeat-containing protein 1 [Echinococcus granulosus]|uniref:DEAD box ATP dependent RNA helicase n=1 Tax=Echinococcus granulosus TaxID=6210 RepID=A0A068WCV1_ECHGR|nr:Leucine-rich repeat and WD repeat-containing protein 1 [Echinococcus granulosus]CDS15497.1 DEAD box ATP dependent RNA helicase [Echinococcus granulosus]